MTDQIFADKFKRAVSVVALGNTQFARWKWHSQVGGGFVFEANKDIHFGFSHGAKFRLVNHAAAKSVDVRAFVHQKFFHGNVACGWKQRDLFAGIFWNVRGAWQRVKMEFKK